MTPTHNVFFSISNPFEAKSPVRLNPSKLKPPNPSQPITTHHPTHHLFIISTWNKITPYMLSFFLFVEQNSKRWWVWWVFLKKHKVRTINFLAKTAKNLQPQFYTNLKSTHHPSPITSQYHCTFLFNIKIYIATNGLNLHNHYHYQWYYHQTNRSF